LEAMALERDMALSAKEEASKQLIETQERARLQDELAEMTEYIALPNSTTTANSELVWSLQDEQDIGEAAVSCERKLCAEKPTLATRQALHWADADEQPTVATELDFACAVPTRQPTITTLESALMDEAATAATASCLSSSAAETVCKGLPSDNSVGIPALRSLSRNRVCGPVTACWLALAPSEGWLSAQPNPTWRHVAERWLSSAHEEGWSASASTACMPERVEPQCGNQLAAQALERPASASGDNVAPAAKLVQDSPNYESVGLPAETTPNPLASSDALWSSQPRAQATAMDPIVFPNFQANLVAIAPGTTEKEASETDTKPQAESPATAVGVGTALADWLASEPFATAVKEEEELLAEPPSQPTARSSAVADWPEG